MIEEWKKIDDYNYEVSSLGRIRNESGKIKSLQTHKNGYISVSFWKNNKEKRFLVHRLVAKYFIGCIDGMEINHKNCNKANNTIDNLEVVTKRQNIDHAKINKRFIGNNQVHGDKNPSAKLSWDQVNQIRKLHSMGKTRKCLLSYFPIKKSQLNNILSWKSWKNV